MPTSARTPRGIAGGFGGLREGDGRLEERRVQERVSRSHVPPSLHEEADEETEDEGDDDAHAGEGSEVRGAEDGGEMTLMLEGDAETGEVQERGPRQQQRGLRVKRPAGEDGDPEVVRAGPGEPPDGVEELESTRADGGAVPASASTVVVTCACSRWCRMGGARSGVTPRRANADASAGGAGRPRRRAGRDPPRRGSPQGSGGDRARRGSSREGPLRLALAAAMSSQCAARLTTTAL